MKISLPLLVFIWVHCDTAKSETIRRVCRSTKNALSDVDTNEQLHTLNFKSHVAKTSFWNRKYDQRYLVRKKRWIEEPLKIIVVPYMNKNVALRELGVDNVLDIMTECANMTFLWSDMEGLEAWWNLRSYEEKKRLKSLIESKRLEITTGSLVQPDQGLTSMFGLINAFTEGHQWLWTNLKVAPRTGWNPTVRGLSPSVSYIMKKSGVSLGNMINKVQGVWKERLAELEMGDFLWRQSWDMEGIYDLLTHHHPYNSADGLNGCGPYPEVCSGLNFHGIGETTLNMTLTLDAVKLKSELFLSQVGRTASLFPHNVVLLPIGGSDFGSNRDWNDQYLGLTKVFDFINNRSAQYNAQVGFGTPREYFKEVTRQKRSLKTLTGDFFPYFNPVEYDGFFSGGFFNKPFQRGTVSYFESELRNAEVLFTLGFNHAQLISKKDSIKLMGNIFERLLHSRAAAASLLEPDSISGFQNEHLRLHYRNLTILAIEDILMVQSKSIEALLLKDALLPSSRFWFIHPIKYKASIEEDPYLLPLSPDKETTLIIFNSLITKNRQLITLMSTKYKLIIKNHLGEIVPHQVTPFIIKKKILDDREEFMFILSKKLFFVHFFVDFEGLSLKIYKVVPWDDEYSNEVSVSKIQCQVCAPSSIFRMEQNIVGHEITIGNSQMRLVFDHSRGLLQKVINLKTGEESKVVIKFGSYRSYYSNRHILHISNGTHSILNDFICKGIVITGPILSNVVIFCGDFLRHMVTLYNTSGALGETIEVGNLVDLTNFESHINQDIFMRVETGIKNGLHPEFFTDSNGFQVLKRKKFLKIGLQGNYYPITSHAFIQDDKKRLTVLVDRSQGVSSWWEGRVEVILDRYINGEPNSISLQKYWLVLESVQEKEDYPKLSGRAYHLSLLLKSPAPIYYFDDEIRHLHMAVDQYIQQMPSHLTFWTGDPVGCDVHLVNLRTMVERYSYDPLPKALLTLHRTSLSCATEPAEDPLICPVNSLPEDKIFTQTNKFLQLKTVVASTSLTGTNDLNDTNSSLCDIHLPSMELMTFKMTFIT